MTFTHGKIAFRKILLAALSMVMAILLTACGGGGGSPGNTTNPNASASASATTTTTTTPAVPTITVQLLNASGTATSLVTTSTPLTAQATVLDATGKPIANTLVNFSTGKAFTSITPSSAAVLTNSQGVATVTLSIASLLIAQTEGGSGDILTASATIGTTAITATTPFSIGSTAVTLSLVAPNPSTLNMTAYSSTLIKVNVLANGAAYTAAPVVVNFSSACATSGKATLPATATTVNGQAQVSYTDNGCSATDVVSISVAGATSIAATLVIAPPAAASITFVSATPTGDAIVIQGAGGNGRVETATLTFEALDTFGNPLPNETVNFSVNSTEPVTLESTSAVTGTNGQVVVTVSSGTLPTTFRVIATLPTGQSTISDTISVTTGQPVQTAFSLSAVSSNIEGWNYDNIQTTLNILLADASGNPVADGTPVVFETDSGAVGSSSNGGCVTTNGGCSVIFRSQNPRFGAGQTAVPAGKRAGLATISVSTTSALYTLSGQVGVFLSGSFPVNSVQSPAGTLALSSCGETSVTLQLNDVNFNPMPEGTTITATPSTSGSSPTAVMSPVDPILPATVLDIGPHDASLNATLIPANMAANQGSVHTFTFAPGSGTSGTNICNPAGTGIGSGIIYVNVTTPQGNASLIQVAFTYPK